MLQGSDACIRPCNKVGNRKILRFLHLILAERHADAGVGSVHSRRIILHGHSILAGALHQSIAVLSLIVTARPWSSTTVPSQAREDRVLSPVTIHLESALIYRFA